MSSSELFDIWIIISDGIGVTGGKLQEVDFRNVNGSLRRKSWKFFYSN